MEIDIEFYQISGSVTTNELISELCDRIRRKKVSDEQFANIITARGEYKESPKPKPTLDTKMKIDHFSACLEKYTLAEIEKALPI